MKYLFLIADYDEFLPLVNELEKEGLTKGDFYGLPCASFGVNGNEAFILCTYMGKVNSAYAATLALAKKSFDGVISIGYSGAVSSFKKGDIVAGESYVECDFDLTPIGYRPGEKVKGRQYMYNADKSLLQHAQKNIKGIKIGKLGTGDFFLTDEVKREYYKKVFSISAFDMESAAAAAVCAAMDVPYLSIRKISDNADDTASSEYRESLASANEAFSDILLSLVKSI